MYTENEKQLKKTFPFQRRIKPLWRPDMKTAAVEFEKRREKATSLDLREEAERVIMYIDELALTNAKIIGIDNAELPKDRVVSRNKEENFIDIVVEFATEWEKEEFAREYSQKLQNREIL